MKKVILSLLAVAFSGSVMFAQTNSDASGNMPTVSLLGYNFLFNGNAVENCNTSHVPFFGQDPNMTFNVNTTTNSLDIVTNGSQTPYTAQKIGFTSGNCVNASIDLSVAAQQIFTINLTTTVAVPEFLIYLYDVTGAVTSVNPTIVALTAGANTVSVTSGINFSEIDESQVGGMGFVIRKAYNDATVVGTVSIQTIRIGDAVTTAGTSAAVNNSLLSVYPNPAKDQINIDLSSLNTSDAAVKIMNSNGMLVYEGRTSNSSETINTSSFNKGIYLVQVSSGNNVSNKKIVIE